MDIEAGSTAGRDAVRVYVRAGTNIDDAEMQAAWDVAVDVTEDWIRDGYTEDAPAGVIEFVTAVAAHVHRTKDSAGDMQVAPDGSFAPGQTVTSNLVRRYAILGGRGVRTPRVIV